MAEVRPGQIFDGLYDLGSLDVKPYFVLYNINFHKSFSTKLSSRNISSNASHKK